MINLLVGQSQLARSSNTPGKTRGIHFYLVHRKLYFADLPGYGYARTSQETRRQWGDLIGRYLEELPEKNIVLVVLDCRLPPSALDLQMRDWLENRSRKYAVVLHKADKISRGAQLQAVSAISREMANAPVYLSSSPTGLGREAIWNGILDMLEMEKFPFLHGNPSS